MKKFLFLLALTAVARKVIAAVKSNETAGNETANADRPNETFQPSAH